MSIMRRKKNCNTKEVVFTKLSNFGLDYFNRKQKLNSWKNNFKIQTNTNLIVKIRLLFKRIKKKLTCPIFKPNFERRVLSSFFYSFNFEFWRLHFVKTLKNLFWSQNSKNHDVTHGWEWPWGLKVCAERSLPG